MTDFAFVLGTGRCGSTLVQEVLARHEQVGFVTNLDDRFGVGSRASHATAYRRLPSSVTQKGRVRFAPSEAYRVLEREVSPVLSMPFRDLTGDDVTPWLERRFRAFFAERAERQGLPVFLHKFTGWPRTGLVHAIMPDARYVNIVRDGRAVANSWLQMPWWRGHLGPDQWHFGPLPEDARADWEASGQDLVVLAGLAWRILMDAYELAAKDLPAEQWLELRYEDVVADPRGSFARMLEFLGLRYTADFERQLGRYVFSSGRADAFRRDLSEAQVLALDEVLERQLGRHGYR